MSSNSRGTGRTTALLEHAKKRTDGGRDVYVLAAHEAHARFLRGELGDYAKQIGVGTARSIHFDWNWMESLGSDSNFSVLIDHFTYESKIAELLSEVDSLKKELHAKEDELFKEKQNKEDASYRQSSDPRSNLTKDDLALGAAASLFSMLILEQVRSGPFGGPGFNYFRGTQERYIEALEKLNEQNDS